MITVLCFRNSHGFGGASGVGRVGAVSLKQVLQQAEGGDDIRAYPGRGCPIALAGCGEEINDSLNLLYVSENK